MFGLFKRKDTVSENPVEATQKAPEAPKTRKTGSTSTKTAKPLKSGKNRGRVPSAGTRRAKTMTAEEKQALLDSARIRASKNAPGRSASKRGEEVPVAPRNTSSFRLTAESFADIKRILNTGDYTRKQVSQMTGVSVVTIRRIASSSNFTEYRTLQALENESYGDNDSNLKISKARTSELSQYKRRPKTLQTKNKRTTKTSQKNATKNPTTEASEILDKEATCKARPESRMSSGTACTIAKMKLMKMAQYLFDEAKKEESLKGGTAIAKHNAEVMEKTYKIATEFCKDYRTYTTLKDWESQKNISY